LTDFKKEKVGRKIFKELKEKANVKLATQASQLQGKIDFCEDRINQIVYQLYELSAEEIKIVEKG